MESLNIYFTGAEQLELRTEPIGQPGPNEVLIEAQCSLISTGTELTCYSRRFAPGTHWDQWVKYPFATGYSHVGKVIAAGADVKGVAVGTRVATRSSHRQYLVRSAGDALPIPDGVSDEDASWFGIASIVQNGVRRAEHALGDTVVVIGLGMLGQLVTQYARLSGASEVIAIDLSEKRLEMARSHGATETLQLPVQEAKSHIERLTEGRLADVVYDVTGFPAVFTHALGLARTFGKVVLLGDAGDPDQQHLSGELIRRGLQIVAAHDSNPPGTPSDHAWWTSRNMQKLFFNYIERGQMQVGDLITRRYKPQDAAAAYADLFRNRAEAMGTLFDWK